MDPKEVEGYFKKSVCVFIRAKLAITDLDKLSVGEKVKQEVSRADFRLREDQTANGIEQLCAKVFPYGGPPP